MVGNGSVPDVYLENGILNMYVKCGSIEDAGGLFENMYGRNLITWNTMIAGYAKHGYGEETFRLFHELQQKGLKPDKVTFLSMLKACASLQALDLCKQTHRQIQESGFELDISLASSMVNMYVASGSIENALQVFMRMPKRDVVLCNVMLLGYAKTGHSEKAFELFQQMQYEFVKPTEVTFLSLLKACASARDLEMGKQTHLHIVTYGFDSNVIVINTLVDMYSKCGSIEHAHEVFEKIPTKSAASWNTIILGYAHYGFDEAFRLFWQMEREGMKPDKVTFLNILKAFTSEEALAHLERIHGEIVSTGFEFDIAIGSALIDTYVKCGSIEHGQKIFDRMPKRNVISWTAMISGYTQHELGLKAFELFKRMELEGVLPNQVTFASILKACAFLGVFEHGRELHAHITKCGFDSDMTVGMSLVNMYARCGSIDEAFEIFRKMPQRDAVTWTAMIAGYAHHGHSEMALKLMIQMQREGIKFDNVTFISLLSACSHGGLVDEGCWYFDLMVQAYEISPTIEHYACIVDLLGRAGNLEQSEYLVKQMPLEASAVVWKAFLNACRIHGITAMAKLAAEHILQLDPESAAAFVQLSNVYAAENIIKDT